MVQSVKTKITHRSGIAFAARGETTPPDERDTHINKNKITPPADGVINLSHVVDEKGLHRFQLFVVPILLLIVFPDRAFIYPFVRSASQDSCDYHI